MAEIAQADPHAIVVVEAAILVETGRYKSFDRLIVVTCTAEQQMERAMERGSYSKEEVLARLSRQLPLEEKLRVADYVIDTSGSKEATLEQVRAVYGNAAEFNSMRIAHFCDYRFAGERISSRHHQDRLGTAPDSESGLQRRAAVVRPVGDARHRPEFG